MYNVTVVYYGGSETQHVDYEFSTLDKALEFIKTQLADPKFSPEYRINYVG